MVRRPGNFRSRLGWFFGLWLTGVLCVTAVGYGIRLWLGL